MPFRKNLRIGNIRIQFTGSNEYKKYFETIFKKYSSAGKSRNPVNYSMEIIKLERIASNKPLKKYSRKLIKDYMKKLSYYDLGVNEIYYLLKSFWHFRDNPRFEHILKKIRGKQKLNFIMTGLDTRTVMLINTKKRRGVVLTERPSNWKSNAFFFHYAFVTFLGVIASTAKSFLLHCSTLSYNNKGYLFVGESGAGKSTIAKIMLKDLEGSKLISDDSALICRENGCFNAYGIPISQNKLKNEGKAGFTKINRVFFIKKSTSPSIRKIKTFDSLKNILANHFQNQLWIKDNTKAVPNLVLKFVKSFSPEELRFKKDAGFTKLLLHTN